MRLCQVWGYLLQGIRIRKLITCPDELHPLSFRVLKRLVPRIIDPTVLRTEPNVDKIFVFTQQIDSAVL